MYSNPNRQNLRIRVGPADWREDTIWIYCDISFYSKCVLFKCTIHVFKVTLQKGELSAVLQEERDRDKWWATTFTLTYMIFYHC